MPRARSRLFKRKRSPFWQASWTDHQGRAHEQSTGCRDHGAAAAWLAARELERVSAAAGLPVAQPVSLLQATAEYLAEREPEWSPGWWTAVEGFVRLQVVPHFGEQRTVASIRADEVARFRVAQIGRPSLRGKSGAPISPSTVNRLMWAMAAFGAWCVKRRYHTANPWRAVSLPESQLPVPAIEEEQLATVLGAVRPRWRALVAFAVETGLRRSELSRLRWEDIDTGERAAWVVSSHARGLNKGRRLRAAPLSREALAILEALPRRPDGYVFGKVGDPRRSFKTAASAAGLSRVWLHLFRHVGASRFAGRPGTGMHDLKAFGGWTSTRMAERYSHTTIRRLLGLLDGPSAGDTTQAQAPGNTSGGTDKPAPPEDDS